MSDIRIGVGKKELDDSQVSESHLKLLDSASLASLASDQIANLFGDPEIFRLVQQDQVSAAFQCFQAYTFGDDRYDEREITYFTAAFEDATACVIALFSIFRKVQKREDGPDYQIPLSVDVDYMKNGLPVVENRSMQVIIDSMEDFMADIDEPVGPDLYDPSITCKAGFDSGCRFAVAALAFRHEELSIRFDLAGIEEVEEPAYS